MDSIQTSIEILFQKDIEQRWRVAGQLVQQGELAVMPVLAAIQAADWSVKHILIWVLGELRDDRTRELLVAALEDESLHVRLSAARALEKFSKSQS